MKKYTSIVVGAGFAGSVAARELVEHHGEQVLILEQRSHPGGNAYDLKDPYGILVHQYGPHIFHTTEKKVYDYLSQFTKWRSYEHKVVAKIGQAQIPVPFNLKGMIHAFGTERAKVLQAKMSDAFGESTTIHQLLSHDEHDFKEVADYVYNNIFAYYTKKQWGIPLEEVDPSTASRVPIRLNNDDRYFSDPYQGVPLEGYTQLFMNILDHPNIEVAYNVNAIDRLDFREGTIYFDGEPFNGNVFYTGAIDQLFDHMYGALPYRTLDFVFEHYDIEYYQTHGTVNYTVSEDFTRITEFKYLTGQEATDTSIMKEYPRAYEPNSSDIPYYPISNDLSQALYKQYIDHAHQYHKLHLLGRLAQYRYYNMDQIVLTVLNYLDTYSPNA